MNKTTSARAGYLIFPVQTLLSLMCLLLLVSGCSTPTKPESKAWEVIKGNTESIAAPMDVAWASVLEVMAQRGWLIQQTDPKSHLILATREIRDEDNEDISHKITATVTLVPTSEQITQVIGAANMTTELHKKSTKWFKLLWIIPIFPKGTEYTNVVLSRDTVHDPQLYQDFFTAVKKRCEEKKALLAPAAP